MEQYVILLSRFKIWLVFFGILIFGVPFLYIPDIGSIVIGFGIIMYGLHEFIHLLALESKRYKVVGMMISPLGIGLMTERPIHPKDSAIVYLSGLISIVVPIFMMNYTLELGILLLVVTIFFSIADISNWRQLKRSQKEYAHTEDTLPH